LSNEHDPDDPASKNALLPPPVQARYENGRLYYVRGRNGDVSVARYFARHDLFYAVGDAIGYFRGDLTIGKPVPLHDAFEN
jgi:hypothetical protein